MSVCRMKYFKEVNIFINLVGTEVLQCCFGSAADDHSTHLPVVVAA